MSLSTYDMWWSGMRESPMFVPFGTWSEPANREGRPRRSMGGQPYLAQGPLSRLRGRSDGRRRRFRA